MTTARARWSICLMTMILIVCTGSRAQAQDTVSITTPTNNPTWISGNGVSVAATVYGSAPVSTMRVTIYPVGTPTQVLYSNTSAYSFTWFINFTCPSLGTKGLANCTVQVDAIASNGVTIVGTATSAVSIETP